MTILVTGGAGFIGSNFINIWNKSREELIINLDNLTYSGNINNFYNKPDNEKHVFVKGDINDKKLIYNTFRKYNFRAVINFAAETHVDRSIYGPENFIKTNILGTFNLLECLRDIWENIDLTHKKKFRFLHISTDEVYGSLKISEKKFTEQNQYKPNSPYSASKASSDHLVRAYNKTYDFPTLITNCSNNYGPYQFPEKLIPLIIHNALKKNHYQYMEMANKYVIGYMLRITAMQFARYWTKVSLEKFIILGEIMKKQTWKLLIIFVNY